MSIHRTRLHVASTSRAMTFVFSPPAETFFRKSPPGTSWMLHCGDLTTHSLHSTLLPVIEEDVYMISPLVTAHHITLELYSVRTVTGSTLNHLHTSSTGCWDWGTVARLSGQYFRSFFLTRLQTVCIPPFVSVSRVLTVVATAPLPTVQFRLLAAFLCLQNPPPLGQICLSYIWKERVGLCYKIEKFGTNFPFYYLRQTPTFKGVPALPPLSGSSDHWGLV